MISGFRFTCSLSAPAGSRVTSVALTDGTAIPDDASVTSTLATNDFVNSGGDGYTMLVDGQGVPTVIDVIRSPGGRRGLYARAVGRLTGSRSDRILPNRRLRGRAGGRPR